MGGSDGFLGISGDDGEAGDDFGGGVFTDNNDSPTFTNIILWDNEASMGPQLFNWSSSPHIGSSLIQGCGGSGSSWEDGFGTDQGGNLDSDPLFLDPEGGEFRLQSNSPAIDAGNQSALPSDVLDIDQDGNTSEPVPYDFEGNSRVMNGAVDMGAIEYVVASTPTPGPSPTPASTFVPTPTPVSTYTPTPAPGQTFADVPPDHWAYDWIEALAADGITSGCGTDPLVYCPDDPVTRAQMAVFLLKGMNAGGYTPPAPDGSHPFSDIAGHWAEPWMEELYDVGLTSGYPDGTYRPQNEVTRAEMAVFLLKSKHGAGYSPPSATGGAFSDVVGHWAEDWIEQLAEEGITGGYPDGTYRPNNPVNRAEMAVFLVNAFGIPLP
jgi:hypothetical protein